MKYRNDLDSRDKYRKHKGKLYRNRYKDENKQE